MLDTSKAIEYNKVVIKENSIVVITDTNSKKCTRLPPLTHDMGKGLINHATRARGAVTVTLLPPQAFH